MLSEILVHFPMTPKPSNFLNWPINKQNKQNKNQPHNLTSSLTTKGTRVRIKTQWNDEKVTKQQDKILKKLKVAMVYARDQRHGLFASI